MVKRMVPYLVFFVLAVLSAWAVQCFTQTEGACSPYFYRYLLLLGVLFILYLVVTRYNKGKDLPTLPSTAEKQGSSPWWGVALCLCGGMIGGALALFLSTAWLSLDSWGFIPYDSFAERWAAAWQTYMTHVSRSGEFLLHVMGIPENQWQTYTVTPVVCLLLPCALFRLLAGRSATLFSRRGFLFYLFTLLLVLLSCNLRKYNYTNFYQLPIAANYLWPMPVVAWFLSCYRDDSVLKAETGDAHAWLKRLLMFAAGCFSCWGPECVCVVILPLLAGHALWVVRKRARIAKSCLWGYMGALGGAFLLFAPPALQLRAAKGCAARAVDFAAMSPTEMSDYFSRFSAACVPDFIDHTSCINFSDIPLRYHLYFLPQLSLTLWSCAQLVLGVTVLLLLCHAVKRCPNRLRVVQTAGGAWTLGAVCAASYMASCLPTPVSYQPAVLIMAAGACYLFLHLPYKWVPQTLLLVVMGAYLSSMLIPAACAQWLYKMKEQARFAEIHRQQAQGREWVVLPPMAEEPRDAFRMLSVHELEGGFTDYPNTTAAKRYGVKGLRQKKQGEE